VQPRVGVQHLVDRRQQVVRQHHRHRARLLQQVFDVVQRDRPQQPALAVDDEEPLAVAAQEALDHLRVVVPGP
jgi:hypothetical protein